MNTNCPICGAPLARGASVCGQCGQPVAVSVPNTRRGFRFGPAVMGFAAIGLCLCLAALVGIFLLRSGGLPFGQNETTVTADTEIYLDEQELQQLEASVDRIEEAFRAGDLTTVNDLTHPAVRDNFGPIFAAHQEELTRVADLLSTRRLLAAHSGMAEYEVTEDGRIFSVTFEQWGDQWYLSAL
jgi:hypothetical protein